MIDKILEFLYDLIVPYYTVRPEYNHTDLHQRLDLVIEHLNYDSYRADKNNRNLLSLIIGQYRLTVAILKTDDFEYPKKLIEYVYGMLLEECEKRGILNEKYDRHTFRAFTTKTKIQNIDEYLTTVYNKLINTDIDTLKLLASGI